MKTYIHFILFFIFSTYLSGGTLSGKVTYAAKPKPPKPYKGMDADPICSSSHAANGIPMKESFVVDTNGGLSNVLVWLENVKYTGSAPKEPKLLDQKGCIYIPHVMGIMKNQELHIANSDLTMHNVHSMSEINPAFNQGQPAGVPKDIKKFDKPEAPFYIKCDVHPWMKAWVGVFDHPYYTVTNPDGTYSIDNIPPGTYDVVFWQERLSTLDEKKYITQSNKSTVKISDGVTNQDFSFNKPQKIQ